MNEPRPDPVCRPNTWEFLGVPMIAPTGFREYDVRWRYPDDINLLGVEALGLGIGAQMREAGAGPEVIVACDYRAYAPAVKTALTLGLVRAGVEVLDIGPAVTPMAYFAQFHLVREDRAPAVAMVTASHNPNGWTGVKMGFSPPLTHGPEEMARLREIVMSASAEARPGGSVRRIEGVREAYLADLTAGVRLSRRLRVVCATGNGGASAFAPALLARLGVDVIPLHAELDWNFPRYNPNPEAMEMLHDIGEAVRRSGADLGLGFDGDGDRCGVVDENGKEIFADRMGVLLARALAADHPSARFVVDVKSTGVFATDPVLAGHGATTEYWRTGHSHMKRRVKETGALAGFERSGHFFFGPPIGRGYDCALRVAVEILKLLDRHPDKTLSSLEATLPRVFATPTLSPHCPDDQKYHVLERVIADLESCRMAGTPIGGRAIESILTVNGARVQLAGGAWALVRASSNTPNLVVVCETPESDAHLRALFVAFDAILRRRPGIADYDQTF